MVNRDMVGKSSQAGEGMRYGHGAYQALIIAGRWTQPILLLLMRVCIGFAFFEAGWGKLQHIENFEEFIASLHIPLPIVNAYLVASIETVGGILLFIGLGTRPAGLILAINMVVAYLTAHAEAVMQLWTHPSLFVDQQPFLYLLTSMLVFAFGPGLFSLDALLKRTIFGKELIRGERS